ncbi:MAG TPA: protein-glutamate O-methyltransferase CheR [Oligoflexus sp.]|uniref:CheR family methyltransferase n=1 Tax=Oligoflexus sp. TaxID=1971216 RepID=UPI002D3A7A89|nr:protein-glutamate O-methyltransferase CheR [Oligoflexus sp.]HYX33153.1 protein-glutamate O-methyltransferase CheR [Oligoflexus sp.]
MNAKLEHLEELGDSVGMGSIQLNDVEFRAIAKLVYDNFGICLTDEKRGLVLGRLQSTLHRRQLSSFSEYLTLMKADRSGAMMTELVNVISTNHTSFFRESSHFQFLNQKVLPEVVATLQNSRRNDLRIWCAACSSGEEAYTLQMSVMKTLGSNYPSLDAGLLATDISTKVLQLAAQGIYTPERIHEIPKDYVHSFFKQQADGNYQVIERVREEIMFRRFNLMNPVFPFKPFQIVFCRNVMIYFDPQTRIALLQRIYNCLEPGGYLFLGHSETINAGTTPLKACMPAVYQKRMDL